ncbi:MAG: hypothetical protein A2521_07205 [Deltaproteobacteria bacterium RIFOXYD12_FULL_57_12]|nr:MAG: hypothetical protein A2521_07205 [Deltaproteobacteria bacterium RIFOXYD12_FULL_57_12]
MITYFRLLFLSAAFILLGSSPMPQCADLNFPALPFSPPPDHAFNHLFQLFSVKEPIHLVLVEKSRQRLLVLRHDGTLRVVAEYPCATGENSGTKKESGDSRTPEGIYFITKIFTDNKTTIFGNRALHLDYPNIFDKMAGRNGDGIYIHGTNKKLVPYSSNGCVTLSNNDLENLFQYMDMAVTPVVIVENIDQLAAQQLAPHTENKTALEKVLIPDVHDPGKLEFDYLYLLNYAGNQSVAVGEYSQRLDDSTRIRSYSRSYLETGAGSGWNIKERLTQTTPIQIYPQYPIKIAALPNSAKFLVAETRDFVTETPAKTQVAAAAQRQAAPVALPPPLPADKPAVRVAPPKETTPVAATQAKPTSALPPVAEPATTKSLPARPAAKQVEQPLPPPAEKPQPVAAMQPAALFPQNSQLVLDFLEKWRQAWESKDIDVYIGSYEPSFRQGGMNLDAWRTHKTNLNKTYSFINIEISDIKINWTKSGAIVSFRQSYRSDYYTANGIKTLHLNFTDKGWAIQRELWAKNKSGKGE